MPELHASNPDGRFAFGENWSSYARTITQQRIAAARDGMAKLLPSGEIVGRTMLDIGCGSGLHALAALELGAAGVVAIDFDPKSVETARSVLARYAAGKAWKVEAGDALVLDSAAMGAFDIVYSWGVLHHTGDLDRAMSTAARLVSQRGLLVLALYRRTRLDAFWVREKRWYANAGPTEQKLARGLYHAAFQTASLVTGKGRFGGTRGMDYWHDMHDWLGGYPYEAISAPEVDTRLRALGFEPVRVFARPEGHGLFGSGCDEYVYRRHDPQG
jgi:SAM-dependent methyltransferase